MGFEFVIFDAARKVGEYMGTKLKEADDDYRSRLVNEYEKRELERIQQKGGKQT